MMENASTMNSRIGMKMCINKECESARGYGRPGESYSDFKQAN